MFKKGYEVFVRNLDDLPEGREIEQEIRDSQTYQIKVVRAIFTRPKDKQPAKNPVWVRALVGHLLDKEPWDVQIVKVIEER